MACLAEDLLGEIRSNKAIKSNRRSNSKARKPPTTPATMAAIVPSSRPPSELASPNPQGELESLLENCERIVLTREQCRTHPCEEWGMGMAEELDQHMGLWHCHFLLERIPHRLWLCHSSSKFASYFLQSQPCSRQWFLIRSSTMAS